MEEFDNCILISKFHGTLSDVDGELHFGSHGISEEIYPHPDCAGTQMLMNYSTSWDSLMPVVEKINGMGYFYKVDSTRKGKGSRTMTYFQDRGAKSCTILGLGDNIFNSTYEAVVEFIKWYNEENK